MSAELQRLERRLYDRLPEQLEEERDAARRALLYGFPQQFALLRDRLVQFVEAAFAPTKLEAQLVIRGVYFTSGTQEGSPIDRVMGALARGFGLERKLLPAQHATGKSYFLTLPAGCQEAGLAGSTSSGAAARCPDRRGRGVRRRADLATLVWWSPGKHTPLPRSGVRRGPASDDGSRGRTGDLAAPCRPRVVFRARRDTGTAADTVPWSMRFGLYQGGRLEAASGAAPPHASRHLPAVAGELPEKSRQDVAVSQDECTRPSRRT
jgi:type VI secretion system protein ImpL